VEHKITSDSGGHANHHNTAIDDRVKGNGDVGFHYDDRECVDQDDADLRSDESNNESNM